MIETTTSAVAVLHVGVLLAVCGNLFPRWYSPDFRLEKAEPYLQIQKYIDVETITSENSVFSL